MKNSPSKISRAGTEVRATGPDNNVLSPSKSVFTTGRSSIDRQSLSRLNNTLDFKKQEFTPECLNKTVKIEELPENSNSAFNQKSHQNFKKTSVDRKTQAFVQVFLDILDQEKQVEDIKRRLFSQPDFNPSGLFNLIQNDNRPYFTFEEFRTFLNNVGLKKISAKTMIDFYSSFDANDKRMLDIDQLVNMVIPSDGNAKNRIFEKPQNPEKFEFTKETKEILKETFDVLFKSRTGINNSKKFLKQSGVEIHEIFDSLDLSQNEKLSKSEFVHFLREYAPDFRESENGEIELFLKSCDIDKDGFINFKDFYMFFSV